MNSKARILVVHGLAAKPDPVTLKAHVNQCLDCLRPDQIDLLYWADLAGWEPRVWNRPDQWRKPTGWRRIVRHWHGITRQIARRSVEHSAALALGLEAWHLAGHQCIVPEGLCALPLERQSRRLLKHHLTELPNYFKEGSELRNGIANRVCQLRGVYDVAIGHSMGSIILVDMIQQGLIACRELVTIGSPLGLGVIQHAMKEFCPAVIPIHKLNDKHWLNVADPLDIVALDATIDGEYQCSVNDVEIENDALTPEGKPHYHSLYGYLRSDPVQELVRRNL